MQSAFPFFGASRQRMRNDLQNTQCVIIKHIHSLRDIGASSLTRPFRMPQMGLARIFSGRPGTIRHSFHCGDSRRSTLIHRGW